MTRLFTGDFSTGDFRQFEHIYNKFGFAGYPDTANIAEGFWRHSIRTVADGDAGYVGRFEVRAGDTATLDPANQKERSEAALFGDADSVGKTRWIAFSLKFDESFPLDMNTRGWGTVFQIHDYPNALSSPVIAFGWAGNAASRPTEFRPGYWYLTQNEQPTLGTWGPDPQPKSLLEIPMNVGKWHDIKMRVKYAQDSTGFIELWINSVRQTFLTGGETFTGQTLLPSGGGANQSVTGAHLAIGLYRQHGASMTPPQNNPTGIVYHKGLRVAYTEDSL